MIHGRLWRERSFHRCTIFDIYKVFRWFFTRLAWSLACSMLGLDWFEESFQDKGSFKQVWVEKRAQFTDILCHIYWIELPLRSPSRSALLDDVGTDLASQQWAGPAVCQSLCPGVMLLWEGKGQMGEITALMGNTLRGEFFFVRWREKVRHQGLQTPPLSDRQKYKPDWLNK